MPTIRISDIDARIANLSKQFPDGDLGGYSRQHRDELIAGMGEYRKIVVALDQEASAVLLQNLRETGRIYYDVGTTVIAPLGVIDTGIRIAKGEASWVEIATLGKLSAARGLSRLRVTERSVANEGIYQFTASSGRTYVGQAADIGARLKQHIATGKLPVSDLSNVTRTEVLGGKTARDVAEQLRINGLGGIQNLENVRNPIGPARRYLIPDDPRWFP